MPAASSVATAICPRTKPSVKTSPTTSAAAAMIHGTQSGMVRSGLWIAKEARRVADRRVRGSGRCVEGGFHVLDHVRRVLAPHAEADEALRHARARPARPALRHRVDAAE